MHSQVRDDKMLPDDTKSKTGSIDGMESLPMSDIDEPVRDIDCRSGESPGKARSLVKRARSILEDCRGDKSIPRWQKL